MAVTVKKLDVRVGDVVVIGDRSYAVVSNPPSGVTLHPCAEVGEHLLVTDGERWDGRPRGGLRVSPDGIELAQLNYIRLDATDGPYASLSVVAFRVRGLWRRVRTRSLVDLRDLRQWPRVGDPGVPLEDALCALEQRDVERGTVIARVQ